MNLGMGIHETAFFASSRAQIPAACTTGSSHGKACVLNRAETRRRGDGLSAQPSGGAAWGEGREPKSPCAWIGGERAALGGGTFNGRGSFFDAARGCCAL